MLTDYTNTSFDNCIKCSICNVYCPVYRVTDKYPGPKHSGPDAERIRMKNLLPIDHSLMYCTNCKRCEIACPSDVKITDMILRARLKENKHKNIIRDYILSHTDFTGNLSTHFSPIVNPLLKLTPIKKLMSFTLGIAEERKFPAYTFGTWKEKNRKIFQKPADEVIVYRGCYAKYNDHNVAIAVDAILAACNIQLDVIQEKCCGVPLIANNFKTHAEKNAKHNIAAFAATGKKPILVSSPSCLLAMGHEYESVLSLDIKNLKPRLRFITEYLNSKYLLYKDKMKPVAMKIAYHAPCHLEKIGYAVDTIAFLKNIPGLEIHLLNSECCGIAGTFGFKKENYQIAQDAGSRLFQQIQHIAPDVVITDCETCKMQIEMSTGYRVNHPVELLQMSLT